MVDELNNNKKFKRKLQGKVVSNSCDKTLVVLVERKIQHGVYEKFIKKKHKYHVHDGLSKGKLGDSVTIIESRPFSKLKRWELFAIN
jgi:small subunit ribosomal protein S17